RRGRPQVPGCRSSSSLVDQRPALVDLALTDEHRSLAVKDENLEVSVAELLGNLERSPQLQARLADLAPGALRRPLLSRADENADESQVSVLGAFSHLLEQALGVHEPTRGDGACPGEEVVAKQSQGETCRTSLITVREVGAERALTRLNAQLAGPAPRRGLADQLQVLGCQLCRIDGHEHVVRLAPRSPRGCLPAKLDEFVDRPRIGHETEILNEVRLDDNRAASTDIGRPNAPSGPPRAAGLYHRYAGVRG